MLRYALIFLIVGLVAGALGFSGVAAGAEGIAKLLFGLFLLGALVLFLIGSFVAKKVV